MEMLVVLAIMSLLAVVAVGNFGRRPEALQRQEISGKLLAAFDAARREAATTGTKRSVDVTTIDPDLTITPDVARESQADRMIFAWPDGSNSGGTLRLKGRPLLKLNWLTGEASNAS